MYKKNYIYLLLSFINFSSEVYTSQDLKEKLQNFIGKQIKKLCKWYEVESLHKQRNSYHICHMSKYDESILELHYELCYININNSFQENKKKILSLKDLSFLIQFLNEIIDAPKRSMEDLLKQTLNKNSSTITFPYEIRVCEFLVKDFRKYVNVVKKMKNETKKYYKEFDVTYYLEIDQNNNILMLFNELEEKTKNLYTFCNEYTSLIKNKQEILMHNALFKEMSSSDHKAHKYILQVEKKEKDEEEETNRLIKEYLKNHP